VPLVQYRDGSIFAMSLSQPGVTYLVQLDPASCQCPGFQHRGSCCHLAAALARFGRACEWCRSHTNVQVYRSGWCNGAEVALCTACFTPLEVR
jgi:hypothetical protein